MALSCSFILMCVFIFSKFFKRHHFGFVWLSWEEATPAEGYDVWFLCCSLRGKVQEVKNETEFRLDEGLDLVVSHNSMKCVANLLLAVNRMKKSPTRFDKELSGDELCCMIMDSMVDGR